MPLILAGSSLGPSTMKSLYITSKRSLAWPSATNLSSSPRAWTSSTSASPLVPISMACPVPTATMSTLQLFFFSKSGRMKVSKPESAVLVVVARRSVQPEAAGLAGGLGAGGWGRRCGGWRLRWRSARASWRCPQAASNRVKMVNPMSKRLSFIFSSPDQKIALCDDYGERTDGHTRQSCGADDLSVSCLFFTSYGFSLRDQEHLQQDKHDQ